ncbi:MAG: hypothetical protein Q8R76_06540 [Candidatus Omnitrophota bacterium]|nr:hypothetical protein [Candidatus Omnitrophota bacterium]
MLTRKNSWHRILAVCVLVTFVATNVSAPTASAAPESPPAINVQVFPDRLEGLQVPEKIGQVQRVFNGQGDRIVIVIQDAHAIPEAQWNIKQLIDFFQQIYGVRLVTVEGAPKELSPQIFKSFPEQRLLKSTFKEYLTAGEATGDTLAAIFNTQNGIYRGIEDWPLYELGFKLFLQAMQETTAALEELNAVETELNARKQQVYSRDLLEVDTLLRNFYQNYGGLIPVLQRLSEIKAPDAGSEIALLLGESMRGDENLESVELEVKKLPAR